MLRSLVLWFALAGMSHGMSVWFTGADDVICSQIVLPVGGVGEVHAWVSGVCTDLLMDYGLFSGPALITEVLSLVPNAYVPVVDATYAWGFGAPNITDGPAVHFATILLDPGLYGVTLTYSMPIRSAPDGVALLSEPELFTWQQAGDMNADGHVNGLDVRPFVDAVITGSEQHMDEPAACVLLAIGFALWPLRVRIT